MGKPMKTIAALLIAVSALARAAAGADPGGATADAEEPFSFYFWTDTHFDGMGGGALRDDAVDDMNRLAGVPMPAGYGTVAHAAFVLHGGDITANARPEMWENDNDSTGDDFLSCTRRLDFPVYVVRGNHDADGGRTCIADAVRERHGALSYSFDHEGIHFVGLDFPDRPAPAGSAELTWLAEDLAAVGPDTPVIIWQHRPLTGDASWNAFHEVVSGYNIVLLLHGDSHRHRRYRWRGFDAWDGGHNDGRVNSWSDDPSTVSVFRVGDGVLRGARYLTVEDRWETTYMLEKPLRPPAR